MQTVEQAKVFAQTDALRSPLTGAGPLNPKPLTFTLTITLGNDAMQEGNDVAGALAGLAEKFYGGSQWYAGDAGTIRDVSGNTVGSWAVG